MYAEPQISFDRFRINEYNITILNILANPTKVGGAKPANVCQAVKK